MNNYNYFQFYLLCAVYLFCCSWIGFALLTALFNKSQQRNNFQNCYLSLFFSLSCGIALHIVLLFVLGLIGILDKQNICISSGIALILSSVVIAKYTRHDHFQANLRVNKLNLLLNLLIILGIFLLVASFALRAPGNWDDTSYHLPYAQYYLDHKSLQMDAYLRFPLFPNHMDLLFAFGLVYDDVLMAQAMATLPLFVIAIGLIGACKQFLHSFVAGILASGLFFYLGPVQESIGYAYIDNGLALFCWASLLALMQIRTKESFYYPWILVAALLAGTAADIKLFGVIWAALLCGYIALDTKQLRSVILFSVGTAIVGSWWYLRSFWISGDPVHPMGGSLFGYYLWNAEDLISQNSEQATHGVTKNLLHTWSSLVTAKITWIAPAFVAPLFFRHIDRPALLAYIVFLGYFLFWFFVTQVSRYLAPVLPLASFLAVYSFYRFGASYHTQRLNANSLLLGGSITCTLYRFDTSQLTRSLNTNGLLLSGSIIRSLVIIALITFALKPALKDASQRMDEWNQTLASRAGYNLYQHANSLDPKFGKRLIQVGFENSVYFYQGLAIGDWFGLGRYSQFIICKEQCDVIPPEQMVQRLAFHNSAILVINTERFKVDLNRYSQYFDIRYSAKDGYLMTLK